MWRLSGRAEYVAGEGPLTDDDLAASDALLTIGNRSIVGVDRSARKLMVDRLPHGLVAVRDALAVLTGRPPYYMPLRAVVDFAGRALAAGGVAVAHETVLDVEGEQWRVAADGVLYADWVMAAPTAPSPPAVAPGDPMAAVEHGRCSVGVS